MGKLLRPLLVGGVHVGRCCRTVALCVCHCHFTCRRSTTGLTSRRASYAVAIHEASESLLRLATLDFSALKLQVCLIPLRPP